ncbi:MAG: sigma-54 dependent transcriptional regulator [Anaerohalosphaeraceae bacterium]|nr:sigma-54 dependent transcriptional regulator [Anaerohalosphaeraceae bacterium]
MNGNETNNNNQPVNVLIIDKDSQAVRVILGILARKGFGGTVADNKKAAVNYIEKNSYDVIFNSIEMPDTRDGFDMVGIIKNNLPEAPVIMTGRPEYNPKSSQSIIDMTVKSIKAGYCDFVAKPLNCKKVEDLLDTILPNHNVSAVDSSDHNNGSAYKIVGKSPKLIQAIELAKKIAPTSAPVVIGGESGTGKELVACLIHRYSKRANSPYMRINCAALSDSLLESELFGHEKGAFTGAHSQRKGRFELAHGGTLLLDEITETPIKFQAKLLRVLEQQDFERVGGNDSVKVDVRIISTTNKDMLNEVAQGRFRQDLYYRLCGLRLILPPLGQRTQDLGELVWHFVNLYARENQRKITKLDQAMMDMFTKYHWPGNVRQLRNVVRTSLILGSGPTLSLADVSWLFDELQPLPQKNEVSVSQTETKIPHLAGLSLEKLEHRAILDTLEHTSGNQTKAAKILGISDRTLRKKVCQYRQEECLQTV